MERHTTSDADRLTLVDRYVNSDDWHVRRFCQEDWVLHIRVYRVRWRKRYEVALFLAEDHWKYEKDSGILGGLVFALSEAFHQVGRMEMHFLGPPEGHESEIPQSIRRVAADRYGLVFTNKTMISDDEGRKLYEKITGFPEEVLAFLAEHGISRERACFVVQRGIWNREQVEFLARYGRSPERILRGGALPENRLSYQADIVLLRIALMAERIRVMVETHADRAEADVHVEWKGVTSLSLRSACITTLEIVGGTSIALAGERPTNVDLAPRDAFGYQRDGLSDLPPAAAPSSAPTLLFVTRDILHTQATAREKLLRTASDRKVAVVAIVDTLAELDSEIERRLARAASTERQMPERPD